MNKDTRIGIKAECFEKKIMEANVGNTFISVKN